MEAEIQDLKVLPTLPSKGLFSIDLTRGLTLTMNII